MVRSFDDHEDTGCAEWEEVSFFLREGEGESEGG